MVVVIGGRGVGGGMSWWESALLSLRWRGLEVWILGSPGYRSWAGDGGRESLEILKDGVGVRSVRGWGPDARDRREGGRRLVWLSRCLRPPKG